MRTPRISQKMEWESGEAIAADSSFIVVPEETETIYQAVRYKDIEMISRQLNHGVDVNIKHVGEPCYLKLPYLYRQIRLTEYSPLHIAVLYSDTKVLDCLLSHGADINVKDGTNRTPLYLATAVGRLDVIDYLLNHGADPDIQSSSKRTPIMEAICRQDLPAVRRLIASGCNLRLCDIKGSTVLYFSVTAHHPNMDIISALLEAGVDVNERNSKWAPVFMVAVAIRSLPIVQLLYNAGADINIVDNCGRTGFHLTAEDNGSRRRAAIMDFLLSHGADPDSPDVKGVTPLQKAVKYGNLRVIERLLKADCDRSYDFLTAARVVYLCDNLPRFKEWLNREFYNPRALGRLCRGVVRKALVRGAGLGCVGSLEIPRSLVDFILAKHFMELEI